VLKGPVGQNFDWSGWYVGSHLGYAVGSANWSASSLGAAAPALTGSLDLFNAFDAFKQPTTPKLQHCPSNRRLYQHPRSTTDISLKLGDLYPLQRGRCRWTK